MADVDQIVHSLEAAEEMPPRAHIKTVSIIEMPMVLPPDIGAIQDAMSLTEPAGQRDPLTASVVTSTIEAHGEEWTDGHGRLRAEATFRMDKPNGALDSENLELGRTGWVVKDGEHVWFYEDTMNTYTKLDADDIALLASSEAWYRYGWPRLFAHRGVQAYEFELSGVESVLGRTVYRLRATPRPDTEGEPIMGMFEIRALELLVDAETGRVIRSEANMRLDLGVLGTEAFDEWQVNDNPDMEARWVTVATSVDFEPELSEELFTFEPPVGATELDPEYLSKLNDALDFDVADLNFDAADADDLPEVDSLAEAAKYVQFPVLEPSKVPASCELVKVEFDPLFSLEHDPDVFVFSRYACDSEPLTISQAPSGAELFSGIGDITVETAEGLREAHGDSADVHAASVSGHAAVVVSLDSSRWVRWDTGKTLIEVHANLDEATLLQLAESMR